MAECRKKREVVVPQLNTEQDKPCPQAEWRAILEQNIVSDLTSSAYAIQGALYKRYDHKFLVVCGNNSGSAVNHVANGDGYCSVVSEKVWCQAAALED
ncbi:hypothetical protein AAVH_05834 [Aphelenchoides avenae]|nr:hypothetical protein AAVH_05834 [Aphelenchus avenae]